MAARESAEARKGLKLIAEGVPLRVAAERVGVSPSTLVRARKRRDAAPLARGRPKAPPTPSDP